MIRAEIVIREKIMQGGEVTASPFLFTFSTNAVDKNLEKCYTVFILSDNSGKKGQMHFTGGYYGKDKQKKIKCSKENVRTINCVRFYYCVNVLFKCYGI